jgi:hypothetical protein
MLMIKDRVFREKVQFEVRHCWSKHHLSWHIVLSALILLQAKQRFKPSHPLYLWQSLLDDSLSFMRRGGGARRLHLMNKPAALFHLYRLSAFECMLNSSVCLMQVCLNQHYVFKKKYLPESIERNILQFVLKDVDQFSKAVRENRFLNFKEEVKQTYQELQQLVPTFYDFTRGYSPTYFSRLLAQMIVAAELMLIFIPLSLFIRQEKLIFISPFFLGLMLMYFDYVNQLVALILSQMCHSSLPKELVRTYAKVNFLRYFYTAQSDSRRFVPDSVCHVMKNVEHHWARYNRLQHEWEKVRLGGEMFIAVDESEGLGYKHGASCF